MRKHKDNGLNILQFIFPRRSLWSRFQSKWRRHFPVYRCHELATIFTTIISAVAGVVESGLAAVGLGTSIVGGTSLGYAVGWYVGSMLVYGAMAAGTSLLSTLLTNTGKNTTMSIGGLQVCKREAQ